jgi:predicted Zn-dependent protease
MSRFVILPIIALFLSGCATSPLGNSQLLLFSPDQVAQMGGMAFQHTKEQTPVSQNKKLNQYIRCVANAIIHELHTSYAWEVRVFDSAEVNAFALPGGKVGIYTGILKVAENQHQLAAVIGHEIAHVLANHPNARLSREYATEMGLSALSVLSGGPSAGRNQILGLLGVGAKVGVLLPYERGQESEADLLGLDFMAQAGFDPRESILLWRNMAHSGGQKPPEFISTHPSDESRIHTLEQAIPKALDLYEGAHARGLNPQCQ